MCRPSLRCNSRKRNSIAETLLPLPNQESSLASLESLQPFGAPSINLQDNADSAAFACSGLSPRPPRHFSACSAVKGFEAGERDTVAKLGESRAASLAG